MILFYIKKIFSFEFALVGDCLFVYKYRFLFLFYIYHIIYIYHIKNHYVQTIHLSTAVQF